MSSIRPIYIGKRNFLGSMDLVVSFYTQRCQFKCSFCFLKSRSSKIPLSINLLKNQIDWIFEYFQNEISLFELLSIGNEGSILDKDRFPDEALEYLFEKAKIMYNLKKISFETRPDYITEQRLNKISSIINGHLIDFTVGFETQDDFIRNEILNKNISKHNIENVISLLNNYNASFTSYILLKPFPILKDEDAIEEAIKTIGYLKDLCEQYKIELIIYLNPFYIAKGSKLLPLIKKVKYKPPSIQSVLETIMKAKIFNVPIYTGLWSEGLSLESITNNNDFQFRIIKSAIKKFNKTQDYSVFDFL